MKGSDSDGKNLKYSAMILQLLFYCFAFIFLIFSLIIEIEMTCAVNLNSCSVRDRWVLECHVCLPMKLRQKFGVGVSVDCGGGSNKSCCSFPQIGLLVKHSLFWTLDSHMYFFYVPVHFWPLIRCFSKYCKGLNCKRKDDTCVTKWSTKVSVYRYFYITQDRSIILWTWTLMIDLQTISLMGYRNFGTDTM